jgi:putative transposase
MSELARSKTMQERRIYLQPWHSPAHVENESGLYLLTAACHEHKPIIGYTAERMCEFERTFVEVVSTNCSELFAWTILPNHYHALVQCKTIQKLLRVLGSLHGRSSYEWNGEENLRGRKAWFNCAETGIKSERHFWASLIYVFHNAVKHRYVDHWQDWPFSNATKFLDAVGREEARRLWFEYPIGTYGASWDPPEL